MKNNLFYKLLLFLLTIASLSNTYAQSTTDGFMMGKGYTCLVAQYSKSTWSEYWEGALKRSNGNIGTFTNENVMVMGAIGVSSRLNILFDAAYVQTKSTQGTMEGQKGIQDFAIWAKYKIVELKATTGKFSVFGLAGVSAPITKYVPDFQPFSIGMGTKNLGVKAILHYKSNSGIYVTGEVGYTATSKITIDRDSYLYDGKLYYTNEVPVPDVMDISGTLGYVKGPFRTEAWVNTTKCFQGDDIRLQDMPFPTNKMMATRVGYMAKYFFLKKLAVQGTISKTLTGRNVGDATSFSVALLYTLHHGKDVKTAVQ